MDTKLKIKCSGCDKAIKDGEYIKCAFCAKYYDLECANISAKRLTTMRQSHKDVWKCCGCRNKERKGDNTNTPVRTADQQHQPSPQEALSQSVNLVTKDVPAESSTNAQSGALNLSIDSLRSLIREEMKDVVTNTVGDLVKQHMRAISDKLDHFTATVSAIQAQLDSLKAGAANTVSTMESLKAENKELRDSVMHLKAHIRVAEQQALFCDVDIVGVPEAKGENITHIVQLLASKLGVSMSANDIVSAARVGPALATTTADETRARARPIAVRLGRRALRDELLREARVRRGATTADTDLPGEPRRFYINERLTRENRLLLSKAREIGGRLKWKHVWSRDGRIFARLLDDSVLYKLNSEADLERVFGV